MFLGHYTIMELAAYLRFLKQYVDPEQTATLFDTKLTNFWLPGGKGMGPITDSDDEVVKAFAIMPVAYTIQGTPREEVTLENCISRLEEVAVKKLKQDELEEATMLAYVIATSLKRGTNFAEQAKKSGNNLLFTKRATPHFDVTDFVTPHEFVNKYLEALPPCSPFGSIPPEAQMWLKGTGALYKDANNGDLTAQPPMYKLEVSMFLPTYDMVEMFANDSINLEHSLPTPVQASFDLTRPYQKLRNSGQTSTV